MILKSHSHYFSFKHISLQVFVLLMNLVYCTCSHKKSNYQNTARGGNHAEARGIQYMINNGIDTTDAKQATSHYSCRDCADKQKTHNIINITGEASKQKFGAKIGRKKMEDLW